MTGPLRILLIEDNPDDADLLGLTLRRLGFTTEVEHVATEAALLVALGRRYDIVLSDYELGGGFTGLQALALVRARCPDVPFIVVSGAIGEETAVAAMRQGASDYLLKDRLGRLEQAVTQALEQGRLRRERREADVQLRENAASMTAAQEVGNFGSWELRLAPFVEPAANPVWWSAQCYRIFGFVPEEVEATNALFYQTVHPDDLAMVRAAMEVALEKRQQYFVEHRIVLRSGEVRHVREAGRVFVQPGTAQPWKIVGTVHDITEQKQAEQVRSRLADIMQGMTEACFAVDAQWRFSFVNGRGETVLRHRREEILGRSLWEVFPQFLVTEIEANYQRAMRERVAVTFEAYAPIARRWLDVRLFPSGNGLAAFLLDIDDRKRAEAALRQSEELYRKLITASPDAIVVTMTDATVAYVSDQACALFGYLSVAQALGRNAMGYVAPVDRERAAGNFARLRDEGRIGVNEYLLLRQDGGTFQGEINSALLTDGHGRPTGMILVARDITERKRAEAALRESEERFRQVVETIREVFWVQDFASGGILYVSRGYEEIWGRSCAALQAAPQQWFESIHPDERERVRQAAATRQRAGDYDETYRILRPDGNVRWIRDRAFPVKDAAGEITRVVGVAEDITERKKLEEQFLRGQRLEAIGTLSSGIAHDLNNILAPMLMVAPLLKEKLPDPEDAELLTMVEHGAQRGANIIKQLLAFSRGVEGERGIVQPRHLLREMAALMRETFPRDIEVEERFPVELRPVFADATQIHQVLMNLCVNARDAMRRGGRLTLDAENVSRDARDVAAHAEAKPGDFVCITVSDTGEGIPRENLDRIFEPFFTTKEIGKGTGLGLSTVIGIVKSHGGYVTVCSEVGRGSAFKVNLPAVAGGEEPSPPGAQPLRPGNGETILVVDDEDAIRHAVRVILEKNNYRVLEAANGRDAVSVFLNHRDRVQLVLTDIMMPGMNGVTLIKTLRSLAPRIHVVAASGLHDQDRRDELALLGVTQTLAKPCSREEILKAVERELAAG